MNYQIIILVLIFIFIIIVILFRLTAKRGKEMSDVQKKKLSEISSAKAKILQIGKSIVQGRNGIVIVKLRIEIISDREPAYSVSTVWKVQQANLSQIQPGQFVSVKIDQENEKLIYPNEGWAEFSRLYWEAWVDKK